MIHDSYFIMPDDVYSIELCSVNEIPLNKSRGFNVAGMPGNVGILIVNRNGSFYGYINSCPHTGVPLEWMPDQFLSADGKDIQCALHGARFQVENGLCISGPCVGQSLSAITISIENQRLCWFRDGT